MIWAGATAALDIAAPPRQRMPDLALAGPPEYESIHGIYGLAKLPISRTA